MTIRVIDGVPYVYVNGRGLVPVRGATPRHAETLENVVAMSMYSGLGVTTVPGLEVEPDIEDEDEPKGPIGFRPR